MYGGRITDKELTQRSGLISKLEPGDSVMVDRGFEVDDLLPEVYSVTSPRSLMAAHSLNRKRCLVPDALENYACMLKGLSRG